MALALPDWFKEKIKNNEQQTEEDHERLSAWFRQLLAGSPLDAENFRNKPEDPKPE
jgi:hypothetical protein